MLRWITKEVQSPYGDVKTLHWAVPSDNDEDDEDDSNSDDEHHGNNSTRSIKKTCIAHTKVSRRMLESSEDQLGAVLWNSNTTALNYLHKYIQEKRCKQTPEACTLQDNKTIYEEKHNNSSSSSSSSKSSSSSSSSSSRSYSESEFTIDNNNVGINALWSGINVIELGAGVGCLGVALAMAGAHVVITDIKELFPLMKYNIEINASSIKQCSNGIGECSAVAWRWGPSLSYKELAVRAALQLEESEEQQHHQERNESSASNDEAIEERITQMMISELSEPWVETQEALHSNHVDYVILCDALYGNPKDWPALLYTLTEILSANNNAVSCEIINFCEQRVNDVESGFLRLLDEENLHEFDHHVKIIKHDENINNKSAPCTYKRARNAEEKQKHEEYSNKTEKKWNNGSSIYNNADKQKIMSSKISLSKEAQQKVLQGALSAKRAGYAWHYEMYSLADNDSMQSELGMSIHVTHIRWKKIEDWKEHASTSGNSQHRDNNHNVKEVTLAVKTDICNEDDMNKKRKQKRSK